MGDAAWLGGEPRMAGTGRVRDAGGTADQWGAVSDVLADGESGRTEQATGELCCGGGVLAAVSDLLSTFSVR